MPPSTTSLVNVRDLTGLLSSERRLLAGLLGGWCWRSTPGTPWLLESDRPDLELLAGREWKSALADPARKPGLRRLSVRGA